MATLININTEEEMVLLVQHIVGRHPANSDTVLTSPGASRMHAVFSWEKDIWFVKDLSSANGTFGNAAPHTWGAKRIINRGDKLRFGNSE